MRAVKSEASSLLKSSRFMYQVEPFDQLIDLDVQEKASSAVEEPTPSILLDQTQGCFLFGLILSDVNLDLLLYLVVSELVSC